MEKSLKLLEPHRGELENCAFCPKLCRHSCPVSTVEGRETTTPWGKMTPLHHIAREELPAELEYAEGSYACTGCLRCTEYCDHGNEPYYALSAGRALLFERGDAHPAAKALIEGFEARKAKVAERAVELFGGDAAARISETVYVPGCSACLSLPSSAKDAAELIEGLVGEPVRVVASSCCGQPLFDAGDREGAREARRQFLARIGSAKRVIAHDPGCILALFRGDDGEDAGGNGGLPFELVHLTEFAAAYLDRFSKLDFGDGAADADGESAGLRYHDSCKLGRGLGVYDEPRALLARVLGRSPEEFHQNRSLSECSGAGGLLPLTMPETASAIADERLRDHRAMGGGELVTACPASAAKLKASAGDASVHEMASLLLRSFKASSR